MTMTANPLSGISPRRGFALVVTISLMILLTIVAVGLLTLSTISLRSSASSSAMAEARANARLAMMMAVGQLQRHAGPDQRITATANIAGSGTGDALGSGQNPANNSSINGQTKGLSPVQAGTRHWTGVFTNRDTPASIYTKTPSPSHAQWLVSGSDTEATPITPTDGRCSVGSAGKVSDPTKAVILAGENSVGLDTAGIDRHVAVPLLNVLDRTGTRTAGRYGWWVGDEGVKASINIPEKSTDPSQPASLVAERRGWETIAGLADYPRPGTSANLELDKISSLSQAELLIPSLGSATGGLNPLQANFHSATATSRGLLTDTLNGGTRVDLTSILSGSLPTTSAVSSLVNYPVRAKAIIPRNVAPRMKAPLWDALKDFNDRYASMQGGALVAKAATSDFSSAIAPLITDFRILMGARLKVQNSEASSYNINACGKIAIAIANPYGVPLKWSRELEFEVISMTPSGNKPSRIWNIGDKTAYIPQNSGEAAVFNKALFRIQADTLKPGEARAYTMASNVLRRNGTGATQVVVDLKPFAGSNPFELSNCLELENLQPYDFIMSRPTDPPKTHSLDVRESWQTTLVGLEMRLAGSSGRLRRLERFELDNGYFSPNARQYTKDEAIRMSRPFPLMLYSFQISQPGGEYMRLNLMPVGYEMGMRASTIRTFADFNLQATRFRKPIASYNPPPFFMESNNNRSQLPGDPPGGQTGTGFTRNLLANPLPWGRSPFGSPSTVLFGVPRVISSIAMLQHADLTGDDFQASIAHQPGNAVGNSWATPFVKRRFTSQQRVDYELQGAPNHVGWNRTDSTYYDLSYLLNSALSDSYYFSTIPTSGTAMPEVTAYDVLGDSSASDLRDPVKTAARLMVKGSFNINSTDKNAWKAFLASARHNRHQSDVGENADAAFPRSPDQPDTSAIPPTGTAVDSFSGFRRLTDAQLDLLAEEIVRQVRLRGPFVSLSHFVNRSIGDINRHSTVTRSGPLQAAIDESGLNINHAGNRNVFTGVNPGEDAVTLRSFEGAPRADMDGGDRAERPPSAGTDPDWGTTSTDNNFGSVASIVADRETILSDTMRREQGYRSTGIPGWLTQADVLQVIGPALSARSDTFRIRTFGESLDANGKTVASAYCEAIVQRMPEYTDPSNPPNARGTELSATNTTFGRKFEIVAFRWLTPAEI
jgi:hypothetical protein